MLKTYCREAAKTTKERGFTVQRLNSELRGILDYVDGTLRDHEDALKRHSADNIRGLSKRGGIEQGHVRHSLCEWFHPDICRS